MKSLDRYEVDRKPGDVLYTARKRVKQLPAVGLDELLAEFGRTGKVRRRLNPVVQGYHEIITQPLYDTLAVAVATVFPTQTLFFQTPIGQASKTLQQTNMTQAGILPAPQKYSVRALRLVVRNDATIVDLVALLYQTFVNFKVSQKSYFAGPTVLWTAGVGAYLSAVAQVGTAPAGSSPVQATSNGLPDQRNVYALSRPIQVEQTEQFILELNLGTTFTTQAAGPPPTPGGTGLTILAVLDGELSRAVN